MGFLDGYKDDKTSKSLAVLLTFVLGAYFWGMYNNDIKLNPPTGSEIAPAALILGVLSIVSFIVIGINFNESIPFVESLLFGDEARLIFGIVVGAILISAISGMKNSILPLTISAATNIFFTGFASPIVESIFFRGCLDPTLRRLLKTMGLPFANGIGIIAANVMFAYYHVGVYGLSQSALTSVFIFGVCMSLGVAIMKSLGFEFGAHVLNNLIVLHVI